MSATQCPQCGHQPYDPNEPLPETCDHCPRQLVPGQPFRRVQFVFDAASSIVQGPTSMAVEHQYNLVLCEACAARVSRWLTTPAREESVPPEQCAEPVDLSDDELQEAFEEAEFILRPANKIPVQFE